MTVEQFYSLKNERHVTATNWCQHLLHNALGQRCLEGALIHCYGDHTPAMVEAKRKVEAAITGRHRYYNFGPGSSIPSIPAFNDASNRQFADIMRVVREAKV